MPLQVICCGAACICGPQPLQTWEGGWPRMELQVLIQVVVPEHHRHPITLRPLNGPR